MTIEQITRDVIAGLITDPLQNGVRDREWDDVPDVFLDECQHAARAIKAGGSRPRAPAPMTREERIQAAADRAWNEAAETRSLGDYRVKRKAFRGWSR